MILSGMLGFSPKWVRLAPNGTNSGIFSDQIQHILTQWAKCTDVIIKKSRICPIWEQSAPLCAEANIPGLYGHSLDWLSPAAGGECWVCVWKNGEKCLHHVSLFLLSYVHIQDKNQNFSNKSLYKCYEINDFL